MIIDVSSWQGEIDFPLMKARGVTVCVMRATIGLYGKDDNFVKNVAGAVEADLPWGMYHLWKSHDDGAKQLANFEESYREVRSAGAEKPVMIALDVEDRLMRNQHYMQEMRLFLQGVFIGTTVKPHIYTSRGLWNFYQNGGAVEWASDYPLWVADYSGNAPSLPRDWDRFSLWQFSSQGNNCGTYYGVSSLDVDLNMTWAEWENSSH